MRTLGEADTVGPPVSQPVRHPTPRSLPLVPCRAFERTIFDGGKGKMSTATALDRFSQYFLKNER